MDHSNKKSIQGFIDALQIFAKHDPKGLDKKYFLEAEHDAIHSHVSPEAIPADSPDGRLLEALGWYVDSEIECWSYFT